MVEKGIKNKYADNSSPEDVKKIEPTKSTPKRKAFAIAKPAGLAVPAPAKHQRVCEAGEDSDEGSSGREPDALGRSAEATRKLQELMKSGELVVDEQKRATYEGKCVRMDANARFHYKKKWEILHSKCGKWFTMSEPYNTTKFKLHVAGCRSKGQNGLIDDFFRRQDRKEEGVLMKVTKPGARKHIIVGGHWLKSSPLLPEPKLQACCGIGEEHNEHIPVYISRALTDGAGS